MKKLPLEYENSLPPIYSVFRTVAFQRRHFDASYHLHSLCEMTAVEKGFGKFVVDDISYDLDARHISLVAPNTPHTYISDAKCEKTEWYLMQFPPAYFAEILDFSSQWNLFKNGETAYIYDSREFPKIRKHFLAMAQSKHIARLTAFLKLAEIFITAEKTAIYSTSQNESLNPDRRIKFIEDYVKKNFKNKITMKAIAKLVGMDIAKMGRYFTEKKNISLKQYIKRERILNICKQMAYSDKNISEIAFENGYDNISNFNRQFRAQIGCTPAQYKKSNNTFR